MIDIKFIKRRYKFILILIVLLSISVVSAAYSQTLTISGDGYVRVDADVRITGIKATNSNNGYETYNAKYGKESVYLYTTLPQPNSAVTYEVTIHNKTNYMYIIYDMNTVTTNGTNFECSIDNELKAVGKGIPKNSDTTISITCKYKSGTTQVPADTKQITTIDFTFKRPTAEMVFYDHSKSGTSCDNVQCALDELYERLS